MANSAEPDQLASSEANWSGSTLFAKTGYIRVQQDKGQCLSQPVFNLFNPAGQNWYLYKQCRSWWDGSYTARFAFYLIFFFYFWLVPMSLL